MRLIQYFLLFIIFSLSSCSNPIQKEQTVVFDNQQLVMQLDEDRKYNEIALSPGGDILATQSTVNSYNISEFVSLHPYDSVQVIKENFVPADINFLTLSSGAKNFIYNKDGFYYCGSVDGTYPQKKIDIDDVFHWTSSDSFIVFRKKNSQSVNISLLNIYSNKSQNIHFDSINNIDEFDYNTKNNTFVYSGYKKGYSSESTNIYINFLKSGINDTIWIGQSVNDLRLSPSAKLLYWKEGNDFYLYNFLEKKRIVIENIYKKDFSFCEWSANGKRILLNYSSQFAILDLTINTDNSLKIYNQANIPYNVFDFRWTKNEEKIRFISHANISHLDIYNFSHLTKLKTYYLYQNMHYQINWMDSLQHIGYMEKGLFHLLDIKSDNIRTIQGLPQFISPSINVSEDKKWACYFQTETGYSDKFAIADITNLLNGEKSWFFADVGYYRNMSWLGSQLTINNNDTDKLDYYQVKKNDVKLIKSIRGNNWNEFKWAPHPNGAKSEIGDYAIENNYSSCVLFFLKTLERKQLPFTKDIPWENIVWYPDGKHLLILINRNLYKIKIIYETEY